MIERPSVRLCDASLVSWASTTSADRLRSQLGQRALRMASAAGDLPAQRQALIDLPAGAWREREPAQG